MSSISEITGIIPDLENIINDYRAYNLRLQFCVIDCIDETGISILDVRTDNHVFKFHNTSDIYDDILKNINKSPIFILKILLKKYPKHFFNVFIDEENKLLNDEKIVQTTYHEFDLFSETKRVMTSYNHSSGIVFGDIDKYISPIGLVCYHGTHWGRLALTHLQILTDLHRQAIQRQTIQNRQNIIIRIQQMIDNEETPELVDMEEN